jgi:putative ABC transport system permease protein
MQYSPMFINHLKTAIRSLVRERYYTAIKIVGLSLGLGTSMVLLLYVLHSLSYDDFHPDVDRLYRVNQTSIWNPNGGIFNSTGPAVAAALLADFPEIEEVMRINTPGGYTVRYTSPEGNVAAFNESFDNVFAADSNFFSFFDFKLQEGDPRTALVGKNKVVLSDKAAKKLFGNASPLGKMIQLGDNGGLLGDGGENFSHERHLVEVTGVTQPQPANTHFHFDYLLSLYTNPNVKNMEWSWIWTQVVTYVKLRPDANAAELDAKLKTFAARHVPATFLRLGMDYEEFIGPKGGWSLYLQPVRDIFLYSGASNEEEAIGNRLGPVGDIRNVYILSFVALFILLLAVVNFVNLSTALGSKRAKEVGVKKTLGLSRGSLIAQFQIEHMMLTFVSMLLGLGVMELLRLAIPFWVGIEIPLNIIGVLPFTLICLALPLLIGLLAGAYPSWYLTSFRPAEVLKGKLASGFRSSRLRNSLVVFQFTISIALMAGTLIIFSQLEFFRNQDLGLSTDNVLIIDHAEKLGTQLESFREELRQVPGVEDASISMDFRGGYEDIFTRESDDRKVTLDQCKIDEQFFNTMKLSLVAGRSFDASSPSDRNAAIINENAARQLGWSPAEALGQRLIYIGDDVGPQEIIGVVADFHFQSLRQNITPMVLFHIHSGMWGDNRIVTIKYANQELKAILREVEERWNRRVDHLPLEFTFYDEVINAQYRREEQAGTLFSIFTILSITIAVIGLVGLVAYAAEQRKKEIGIRKVFGASLTGIYVMINVQYVRLLGLSLLIATPITWWLMEQWLNVYPYRVDINPMIFVASGVVELVLALLCVGYLALRAASLNPVVVLKDE